MVTHRYTGPLERVNDYCWRIPKSYKPGMRVDGLIFADERLIEQIRKDQAPEQVANVAFLPGIQKASLAMPDIHWGYGFCIGGVCGDRSGRGRRDLARRRRLRHQLRRAADAHEPVLIATSSRISRRWSTQLFRDIPDRRRPAAGTYHVRPARNCAQLLAEGSRYLVEHGPGHRRATSSTPRPAAGSTAPTPTASATARCSAAATSAARSARATTSWKSRSSTRSSTTRPPRRWAWTRTGQRDDPLRLARAGLPGLRRRPGAACARRPEKYGIELPDRQLACAPVDSPEGQAVPRRDAGRGQLRLVQPAAADAAGPRGLRRGLRPAPGRSCR